MDEPTSPLVLTKLCVPAARRRQIPRPRLLELLEGEGSAGFILVSAPAGYGKTTLLAEFAQALLGEGVAVAWYALDPSDDDPNPFAAYLVASLAQALGADPELARIAQLLRTSTEVDLGRILGSVINAVVSADRDCALILDDYHLIASPPIHTALAYLLEHLPENLRVAIGSRSDPPLPLARLRASARLLEVRAADLRFTGVETASFLNEVMGLELEPDLVASLESRTEGWITGLQLAALSLSGRSDKDGFIASYSGGHRYLVEYLLDEVVSRQEEEVQTFLLATSILERMCAPLCTAVYAAAMEGGAMNDSANHDITDEERTSRSGAILERLDQSNLFVFALDDQGTWYRYHHLFRDFLQTRLLKTFPERVEAMHRAACEWLAAHNCLREAARHAFQAHDWDYAAAFVERHSFTMILHSEISTIYEWCSAFPEEVIRFHPMIAIQQSLALAYSFRRQNRARVEAGLRWAETVIAALEDRQYARMLTEFIAVVHTFLAMAPDISADPLGQLDLAQDMLRPYPEGDPGRFSPLLFAGYAHMALHDARAATQVLETARGLAIAGRLYFGIVESSFHLARLAHTQGRLRRATEICRQSWDEVAALLSNPEEELPALGCLEVALGYVLMEQDLLTEAEESLLHGLDLLGVGMNPYYLMTAYVALARLREIQDRPAEALAYLSQLEDAWPDVAFCTRGLRAVLALRTDSQDPETLAEIEAWRLEFSATIEEAQALPGVGPFGAAEAYYLAYLAWMRTQIAASEARTAFPILERMLVLAQANGLAHRVIELSLLEAMAWGSEGDDERALSALERALLAAGHEGYLRVFDRGPALTRLLVEASRRDICAGYASRILADIETPRSAELEAKEIHLLTGAVAHPIQPSDAEIVEPLSGRELEVLRCVAEGASNQEVAEQLVITVGTVKSHVNHILRKLGAQNRTEAVARARGLGLLDL